MMDNNDQGLLMVTKNPPYEIWDVFYRGEILKGKKMIDVSNEIFDKEVRVPMNIISRLTNNIETLCQAMNENISS